jgi:hypothetical protein
MLPWILLIIAVAAILMMYKYPIVSLVVLIVLFLAFWTIKPMVPVTGAKALAPVASSVDIDRMIASDIARNSPIAPTVSINPQQNEFGECPYVSSDTDMVRTVPKPYDASASQVLESDPFSHPGAADRACEKQWFLPSQSKHMKEQQHDDFSLHRAMRRDTDWNDTRKWTKEDKAKYEKARTRLEQEISMALKPDKYMIVERDPNVDYSPTSDQPFASITSDHQVFHTAQFWLKSTGTGSQAAQLQTQI